MYGVTNEPVSAVIELTEACALDRAVPDGDRWNAGWDAATRVLKAAVLYADDVLIGGWTLNEWWAGWTCGPQLLAPLGRDTGSDRFDSAQWMAAQAGVLDLRHQRPVPTTREIPVLSAAALRHSADSTPTAAAWQGTLGSSLLLGAVEAFPQADMDVILDVRERIAGARTHFRAAMNKAAAALADKETLASGVDEVVADLRMREVAPAIEILREELDALGARRTLLRAASDRILVASSATALAVTAGATGNFGKALGAAAAPLAAAAAKEREHRYGVRQELRRQPFWVLHETTEWLRALT